MNVRLPLVALVSALLLAPGLRAQEEPLDIRTYSLEHVDVREANAILRSVLDIRKTAIDEQRNMLVLHDRPSTLDRATDLLREIDRPAPRWQARLVAVTAGGDVAVRVMPLTGAAQWTSGAVPPQLEDRIALRLTARELEHHVVVNFQLEVAAAGAQGAQSFRRVMEEEHFLSDGDSFDALVVPAEAQAAVARLVGAEHPVRALRLAVERQDAPKARRTPR